MNKRAVIIEEKIDRLQNLLHKRREEYAIFGRTGDDAMRDLEIIEEIDHLKEELATVTN